MVCSNFNLPLLSLLALKVFFNFLTFILLLLNITFFHQMVNHFQSPEQDYRSLILSYISTNETKFHKNLVIAGKIKIN